MFTPKISELLCSKNDLRKFLTDKVSRNKLLNHVSRIKLNVIHRKRA